MLRAHLHLKFGSLEHLGKYSHLKKGVKPSIHPTITLDSMTTARPNTTVSFSSNLKYHKSLL